MNVHAVYLGLAFAGFLTILLYPVFKRGDR